MCPFGDFLYAPTGHSFLLRESICASLRGLFDLLRALRGLLQILCSPPGVFVLRTLRGYIKNILYVTLRGFCHSVPSGVLITILCSFGGFVLQPQVGTIVVVNWIAVRREVRLAQRAGSWSAGRV